MALFGKQETELKKFGSPVEVNERHDECRLSYYLNCIEKGCGLDNIRDKTLLDHKNAHRLPRERKDAIFQLACGFYSLENVIDKVVFCDPDNKLLTRGKSNEFYEVKNITNILAVDSEALIAGRQTQVRKIMVCNENWLNKFYREPIRRYQARARPTQQSSTDPLLAALIGLAILAEDEEDHCDHCRGKEGGVCACTHGCPRKSSTNCTFISKHCEHCKGLDGPCACTEGCTAKSGSMCHVVHSQVICDHCKTNGIKGPRYKCIDCHNYDLCERCYDDGKHVKTHIFERIARVGSKPILLEPREKEVVPPTAPHEIPTVAAIPVSSGTSAGPIFPVGTTVRLTGLPKMELNGLCAVVVHNLGGGQVLVNVAEQSKKLKVNEANLESIYSPIPVGELVELKGLTSAQDNGKLGQVMGYNASTGRVEVQLLGEEGSGLKSIKPENLSVIEDAYN